MLGLSRRTLYIVITRDLLSLRYIADGREIARFEDVPQIAYGDGGTVRAGGRDAVEWAQMPGNNLFHAFDHPRVAVDNYELTVKVLKWFLATLNKQTRGVGVIRSGVLHWREPAFIPLTDIEKRALLEIYKMLDGGVVGICESREELTPQQVQVYKSPDEA